MELTITTLQNLDIYQGDAMIAFFNRDLDKDIYIM